MKKPMAGAKGEPKDLLVEVHNWLDENVLVITHANELTICDFAYNPKNHSGKFSVSVDGEALEGRWRFWLGDGDGWPTVGPPMFTSPQGAPASYAAVELSDELNAVLQAKMREIFPRIAPFGLNRKTGIECTNLNSTVEDRIIDHEAYQNTVAQIESGGLRVTVQLN
ncbi:MAG: hypothetical protein ACKVIF_06030 [Rhodospirillales bacterium]|jgi:hypothetical protein